MSEGLLLPDMAAGHKPSPCVWSPDLLSQSFVAPSTGSPKFLRTAQVNCLGAPRTGTGPPERRPSFLVPSSV